MYYDFELFLARHCAPLFFGKKPAAVFAQKCLPQNCAWAKLFAQGFLIQRLYWRQQNMLVLIYHPQLLNAVLLHKKAQERLKLMGYPVECGQKALLKHLQRRFSESEEFPHEVGFFLGYPPDDVIGFMDCKENYKICGKWKVYGDAEQAAMLFNEYDKCSYTLLTHIKNGGTIFTEALPELANNII